MPISEKGHGILELRAGIKKDPLRLPIVLECSINHRHIGSLIIG